MFVLGAWIIVPRNKFQYRALTGDTGETGGGHWCGIIYDRVIGRVYLTVCAILPPESAALQDPPENPLQTARTGPARAALVQTTWNLTSPRN